MDQLVRAEFRFPIPSGPLAGCEIVFGLDCEITALVREAVPVASLCPRGCGAFVGPSELSGEQLTWNLPDALAHITLPSGVWEAPHQATSSQGEPVTAVVFHDAQRCQELFGGGERGS